MPNSTTRTPAADVLYNSYEFHLSILSKTYRLAQLDITDPAVVKGLKVRSSSLAGDVEVT